MLKTMPDCYLPIMRARISDYLQTQDTPSRPLDTQLSVIDHRHIARALAQLMRAAAWRAGLIARVTQVRPHDLQRPLHSLRLGRQINL